jgi:hypothetical protein
MFRRFAHFDQQTAKRRPMNTENGAIRSQILTGSFFSARHA